MSKFNGCSIHGDNFTERPPSRAKISTLGINQQHRLVEGQSISAISFENPLSPIGSGLMESAESPRSYVCAPLYFPTSNTIPETNNQEQVPLPSPPVISRPLSFTLQGSEHASWGLVVESDDSFDGRNRCLQNRKTNEQEILPGRVRASSKSHNLLAGSAKCTSRPRPPHLLPPTKAEVQATLINGIGEHAPILERHCFDPILMGHTPTVEDQYCFADGRPLIPSHLVEPIHTFSSSLPSTKWHRSGVKGRYPAIPQLEIKSSLHPLVPPHRPRGTLNDNKPELNDEKIWSVFTEDEDRPFLPKHDYLPSQRLNAPANGYQYNSEGLTSTQIQSFTPATRGLSTLNTTTLQLLDAPVVIPPLPQKIHDPESDKYIPIHKSSTTFNTGIERKFTNICESLMGIFHDLTKYQMFLSHRGETAQSLLNFLQTLLDHARLEERFRNSFCIALVHLARKSGLYPQGLTLTDVIREGEYPITDGHFGEIYKGRCRGRIVRLKLVKMYDTSDQSVYKAFAREAVLWGQLSHANVLPFFGIYQLGDVRNRIGLISPWVKHDNINEFLRKYPDTDRCRLISDVAAGLSYLHKNDIIHGNLKGTNILVTERMRACLADFGLSSIADTYGLKTASFLVNPASSTARFQAPELINPDFESPRSEASDVYAFAIVCYEVFTMNRPFPDVKNDYTVMLKVGQGERPARPMGPVYWDRGLTNHIWQLIENCWEHIPENRPTAFQVVERLSHQSADQNQNGAWGDLSPLRFRASSGEMFTIHGDISIPEALISLFQL